MADRPDSPGWLSDRLGLTLLAIVSVALATLVLLPYLQYVLLGIVLAYVLLPAQRRLEPAVGSMPAALALVVATILTILLPLMYVLAIALRQALELLTSIQEGTLDVGDVERRLQADGYAIDFAELYETYQEPIGTMVQGLAASGIELVSGLPGLLIGLTVTLFVLFALLRDGDRLVAWLRTVLPLDDEIQRDLLADLDRLMWASVVGNVAVAAIQAIALGVGLLVLGVPAVVFLTVATFVLSLLPLIGAFGVWIPVAGYLALTGDAVGAVALAVYGSIVSASDTYLRPALIGRTSAFNSAIIVVGIFGGIVVFGAVGLFVGPVVLGGAKVTLDAFARERASATGAADPFEGGRRSEDPAVDTLPGTGIRPLIRDVADTESEGTATDADAAGRSDSSDEPARTTETDGERRSDATNRSNGDDRSDGAGRSDTEERSDGTNRSNGEGR